MTCLKVIVIFIIPMVIILRIHYDMEVFLFTKKESTDTEQNPKPT
jgi:hypothetical protein